VTLPLLLLSGILLPMSIAPTWFRYLSDVNPLAHVVDGARALFRGDLASSTAAWGVLTTAGLVTVALAVGSRTFRRESA
jgi:ABC-2 type transport system permease protein